MKKTIMNCICFFLILICSFIVNVFGEPDRAISLNLFLLLISAWIGIITFYDRISGVTKTYRIKFKKLSENAITPTKGSEQAAGYDLYACIDSPVEIRPHETVKIPTGIAMEIPENFYAEICARSGLATKTGLRPANCVGICDSDYRGEYIVALHNDSDNTAIINPKDRIAQMIIKRFENTTLKEVSKLSNTERGSGGFGSTGR